MKAMILAAGLGSRLYPLTIDRPKAMVECSGRTLLEHAILKLKYFGFTEIVLNVHHFSNKIIDFVTTHNFGIPISISDETSHLLDTGGGLLHAKKFLDGEEPFLICNVDVISSIDFSKMMQYHIQHKALATLAVSKRETSRYLLFDEMSQLCAWENRMKNEKIIVHQRKQYTPLAFSGIQIISPEIFQHITETGAFPIMDLYLRLAKSHSILAYDHTGDFWLDIGKYEELAENERLIKNQKFEYLQ